jgi:hypothetical protein
VLFLIWLGCVGKDEGGCPLDGLDAVGERCNDPGKECGETSLCDPCTSDMSECEYIACVDGTWQEVEMPTVCP